MAEINPRNRFREAVAAKWRGHGADDAEIDRISIAFECLDGCAGWTADNICAEIASGLLVPRWQTVPGNDPGTTTTVVEIAEAGIAIAVVSVAHNGLAFGYCGDPSHAVGGQP